VANRKTSLPDAETKGEAHWMLDLGESQPETMGFSRLKNRIQMWMIQTVYLVG
jgi:hypothetical protein